jgi:hypothetical protein
VKTAVFLGLFCLLFAVTRFLIPTHPLSTHGTYEAFAHLFVGGLIGAWMASRRKVYLGLAVVMAVVELVAFLTLK